MSDRIKPLPAHPQLAAEFETYLRAMEAGELRRDEQPMAAAKARELLAAMVALIDSLSAAIPKQ